MDPLEKTFKPCCWTENSNHLKVSSHHSACRVLQIMHLWDSRRLLNPEPYLQEYFFQELSEWRQDSDHQPVRAVSFGSCGFHDRRQVSNSSCGHKSKQSRWKRWLPGLCHPRGQFCWSPPQSLLQNLPRRDAWSINYSRTSQTHRHCLLEIEWEQAHRFFISASTSISINK